MSIYKKIKSLDSKFSWSFFGFLIGILGFGYAIYVDQFKELKPKLIYDLLSNTKVLSVREDVNKLDIIYDGQNLKEQKENLILLTVRIKNEGSQNIVEGDYYSKILFGLKVRGGKIAEKPQLIDASNKFLKENVSLEFDSLNSIKINKVQIDEGQYFTIKILTICKQNISPSIVPIGKISGMTTEFEVRESYLSDKKEEESFFERLIAGSVSIHVARFFFYLLVLILFSLVVILPTSQITTFFEEKNKKRKIEKFREKTKIELTENIELVFDLYREDGAYYIKWLNKILSDKEKLKKYLGYFEEKTKEEYLLDDFKEQPQQRLNELDTERVNYFYSMKSILTKLVDKKIITKTEDDVLVNEMFKNELMEFNYFIDIQ